ncbi:MAG: hypothetical protein ACXVDZ_16105 [Bacteroidia bacterium]
MKISALAKEIYKCLFEEHLPIRQCNSIDANEFYDDIQRVKKDVQYLFDIFFKDNPEYSHKLLLIDPSDYYAKLTLTRDVMEAFDFNNLVLRRNDDYYIDEINIVLTNYLEN